MTIPLSSPDISNRERELVSQVLSSPTLSLGPMLPRFEEQLAAAHNSRYAIAVNSGTSALHLCVKAAKLGPGDEVITTPFSFVASANCMLFEGATPVFVDIEEGSYNVDTANIADAITSRTRAILPVHVFGNPCDIEGVLQIAARHQLEVIEDSCEAIGATVNGKHVGTFGRTGTCAFYPNKQMTTGEGGAVLTDDAEVAALCRSWRNQGRDSSGAGLLHERLGYNYRLSDINCALGIGQLERLPIFLRKRKAVAQLYAELLGDCEDIILPPRPKPGVDISWFVYVVRLADHFSAGDRETVLGALREAGIGCNSYFRPIHLQPFFRQRFGYAPGDFPRTEHVSQRTVALPFHNNLTPNEVAHVVSQLRSAVAALRPLSVTVA